MRLVVHPGEVLEIEMGIDLGGRNVGVSQQFLHRAEVAGGLQHVAGEAVAQQVGVDVTRQPLPNGPVLDAGLNGARCVSGL